MSTLTEFLLARIAEDEALATEAQENQAGLVFDGDNLGEPDPMRLLLMKRGTPIVSAFPARVLAECEAKRRIVKMHEPVWFFDTDDAPLCRICDGNGDSFYWPCDTLQALADVYVSNDPAPSSDVSDDSGDNLGTRPQGRRAP